MHYIFLGVLFFVWNGCLSENISEEEIKYYEKLILDSKQKAKEYQPPKNADSFRPELKGEPEDFGEFDFIVVGSGSTGSVVAGRLSEVSDWKILLLEAGEFGNNLTSITRMSYVSYIQSDYNWGYYSIPQKTACLGFFEQRCAHPRGKGIGGTNLLNAVIYARGNVQDFDLWCRVGNPGWCYNDVLPYFRKSEDFHHTDPNAPVDWPFHGKGGLLSVEYPMPRDNQVKVFFKANEELGYNLTDINGKQQIGVSPFQLNTRYGRREDSGTAFLVPFLDRTNLKILTRSLVTRILIDNFKVAKGVLFSHGGKQYKATVRKEVIVCGGAINSPQLLMLSGIGPKKHLAEVGIPLIQDLEVGSSFSDHLQIYGIGFSSNLSLPTLSLTEQIRSFLEGQGPLAEALPSQGVGYYRTPLGKIRGYPDLELSFSEGNAPNTALSNFQRWNSEVTEAMSSNTSSSSFSVFITPLHTKSLGTVRLNSSNPYDYPIINPNCMSDPNGRDIELAYLGVQFVLKLAKTRAFRSVNATLTIKPFRRCSQFEFLSRRYWYCLLRYITAHNNHPVSTCKMGPDPSKGSVVDSNLRVYGIGNLRVADASVIPLSTSSHINSICFMIGEKLADMLKSQYRTC